MSEKKYIAYADVPDELCEKEISLEEMEDIYNQYANKTIFQDFEIWFTDMMIKSGIFVEIIKR